MRTEKIMLAAVVKDSSRYMEVYGILSASNVNGGSKSLSRRVFEGPEQTAQGI